MPIKKEGDKSTAFPVIKYGLTGAHHILLEGCTFPPEKRASMAQSVGPMTSLLCHIRTKGIYREKWTLAAKNFMSHVPFIDEILSAVVDKPASEIGALISTVADILRIAMPRQSQRIFYPLNMIAAIYSLPVQMDTRFTVVGTAATTYMGGDYILKNFNVSGNGGFYAYQITQLLTFKIEGSYTVSQARQAVFHSIMGTYKEDLSVLEAITDMGKWERREEFKNAFAKMKAESYSVTFQLPDLKFYSRLASANLSGMLTSNYLQTSSLPVLVATEGSIFLTTSLSN